MNELSQQDTTPTIDVSEPAPALPDKYQGKSPAEIAQMHANAEQALSRQGQELGEMRAQMAQLLANQEALQQQNQEPFEERLYSNPQATVEQLVEQKLQGVQQTQRQLAEQNFQMQLDQKRQGWRDLVNNQEFQQMVVGDPLLADYWQKANQGLDMSSADKLFRAWDLHKGDNQAVTEAVKEDRSQRAAVTEIGAPKLSKGKRFKASELQALAVTNRDEYERLQPQLMQAYAEGRVDRDM